MPKTVFDIGCNTGLYSIYSSSLGAECVGMDSDIASVEVANNLSKERGHNCSFICYDFMSPPPAYGLLGAYQHVHERLVSEMVIAPAVFHHLFRQGHSAEAIISELCRYSTKYVCMEFIPHNDIHISCKEEHWASLKDIISYFDAAGYKSQVLKSYPSPRTWIMAEKINEA